MAQCISLCGAESIPVQPVWADAQLASQESSAQFTGPYLHITNNKA